MSDFDRIFSKYYTSLYLYARKFIQDEPVAKDLVQDVFTLVWEKDKTDLEEEHLKAYLHNSMRNACINHLKHQKVIQKHQSSHRVEMTDQELIYYQSGEKSLIERENLEKIYKSIRSLSDVHREVIELSRFEGLKNKEIAQRLNIPVRTVETRLFRALAALKKDLTERQLRILLTICVPK